MIYKNTAEENFPRRYFFVYSNPTIDPYIKNASAPLKCFLICDEIYESNLIVSAAAEKISAKLRNDTIVIAPADLWSRSKDSGRCVADIFAAGGVCLTKMTPNRVDGWLALKEWLAERDGVPKLRIFPACRNLIRTLPLLIYDPQNSGDVATQPHEITHAPDALRYFASYCRDDTAATSSSRKEKRRFGRR